MTKQKDTAIQYIFTKDGFYPEYMEQQADEKEPLELLYDMRRRMYTLDYPNDEVRRGFVSLMANSYFHTKEVDNENWIIQIDDMLRDCDLSSKSKTAREEPT